MAESQYCKQMEELAKKYAALKREIETSPLFSGDPERRTWKPSDSDAASLVEQYRKAHSMLADEGIRVQSILGEAIIEHKSTSLDGIVSCMPTASTWARGYHALRDACAADARAGLIVHQPTYVLDGQTTIYRPLTLGEDLRARIVDARAHSNNIAQASSWNSWNNSCTAIIYGTDGKFKVQKISQDLLDLAPDFKQQFVEVHYNTIRSVDVAEFDRRDAKYNERLTREEVLHHPFWQFVADGNIDVLRDYTQLQWAGKKDDYRGMAVWLADCPYNGELRALFVSYHDNLSNACGVFNLNYDVSFLRVS